MKPAPRSLAPHPLQADEGYSQKAKWYRPEYDDSQWEEVEQFDKAWEAMG